MDKWNPNKKIKSAYKLMTMLIKEKCSNSDFH